MAKKVLADIQLALRKDIRFSVIEEYSFWTGDTKKIEWSLTIANPNRFNGFPINVNMGKYDWSGHKNLLRFLEMLNVTFEHCNLVNMRELDKSLKLKRILRSMNGLYFRPDITALNEDLYEFDDRKEKYEKKWTSISEDKRYPGLAGLEGYDTWLWHSNVVKVDDHRLTRAEYYFVKSCIRLSYLLNLIHQPNIHYKEYFKFTYVEDCIERAASNGWLS